MDQRIKLRADFLYALDLLAIEADTAFQLLKAARSLDCGVAELVLQHIVSVRDRAERLRAIGDALPGRPDCVRAGGHSADIEQQPDQPSDKQDEGSNPSGIS